MKIKFYLDGKERTGTATHVDYMHPKHYRVVEGSRVLCVSPNSKLGRELAGKKFPKWQPSRK